MHVEEQIQEHGDTQKSDGDDGDQIDLVADRFEIFQEFLLLQGVAVGGLSDHFQLIFKALERGILLDELLAQFAVLGPELGEGGLEGGKVNGRRRRRWWCLRLDEIGDDGSEISIEERKKAMNERKG